MNRLVRWKVLLYVKPFNALSPINVRLRIFSTHLLRPTLFWTWCMNLNDGQPMVRSISFDTILKFDLTHPYKNQFVRWYVSLNINYFNPLSLINVGHKIFPIYPFTCWCYHTLHMLKLIERKMDRVLSGREEKKDWE